MKRRAFNKLAGFTTVAALAMCVGAAEEPKADEITMEDEWLLATFDRRSGALTRLEQKNPRWVILRRSELGVSFRLYAPLPERRDNFILGRKQIVTSIEQLSDRQIQVKWSRLISEHGGVLPINLSGVISLENGALTFEGTLENESDLMVETIDYPYLGEINPPSREAVLNARIMRYDDLRSDEIYPRFSNEKGYWGDDVPTKTLDSCYSLFCLIQGPAQGLYVETHDPTLRYLVQYTFELHPGAMSASTDLVPAQDEIDGVPVHTEFRTCHFIFAHPKQSVNLVPIVVKPYRGDWHAGIDLYKQWRASWYKPARLPAWARDVHSWQQIQMNSPEEEFRIPYNRLIEYGQECANNGVAAIQLVGWNRGGQDRGNPSQDTDPGLGTWQELHDAIQRTQALGVKIILFGKFPWADITTEWYKEELYKYATIDPYGIPYQSAGDSYHTPTQLAGLNNRRFAVMDFLCPAYREIAKREFEKLLKLGAAGWLYDEVCDCVTGKYNFSKGHGYEPPGYIYAGALPLAKQLRAEADKTDPDFLFAGEGPQDWLTQYYPFSYFRDGPTPGQRYIDPKAPIMDAVTGFDDREELNLILLNRYIISYEPYNFKGKLSDFSLTLAYGKKIDVLRRKYREYLWDAEFQDTVGADVTATGAFRHSVFTARNGKRAVVIVNLEGNSEIAANLNLPHAAHLVIATPEEPECRPALGTLRVPARSAVVVMET